MIPVQFDIVDIPGFQKPAMLMGIQISKPDDVPRVETRVVRNCDEVAFREKEVFQLWSSESERSASGAPL